MTHAPFTAAGPAACAVTHAMVYCRLSAIDALRNGGWPPTAPALPSRFLRHCDEQTVVGMQAVLAAIARLPEPRPAFASHGVVAASCQAGRLTAARTLADALAGGGVAVSTQVVPQCSLHSPAGAVSVGLGMHGPNVGVAGGPQALSEGLFTAFSWLATGCDDVWLVTTGWDDEPALDITGKATNDPICRGVAVWLSVRPAIAAAGPRIELQSTAASMVIAATTTELEAFGLALAACSAASSAPTWVHRCSWGAEIRISPTASGRRQEAA